MFEHDADHEAEAREAEAREAARLAETTRQEMYLRGAVITALHERMRADDVPAVLRGLEHAWERVSFGESLAHLGAALWNVHIERAAFVLNGESDIARWREDPRDKPCPTCSAPASCSRVFNLKEVL